MLKGSLISSQRLWSEDPNDPTYSPSIWAHPSGAIEVHVGGRVLSASARDWFYAGLMVFDIPEWTLRPQTRRQRLARWLMKQAVAFYRAAY